MKITVNTQKLIDTIQASKDRAENSYKKAIVIYKAKMEEYVVYLRNVDGEKIRAPPSLPRWDKDRYEKSIKTLELHIGPKLVLEDSEYNEIIEGAERHYRFVEEQTEELASINYLG